MAHAKIAVITQAVKLADEVAGLNRTSYIAELLASEGYEVDLITSTFQHWEKQRRDIVDKKYWNLPYNVVFLDEPGYRKNISLARIQSQRVFGTNLREYLERLGSGYDLIWCQIPPNNIAADAGTYAREHGVPFIVDVNDLWPEAMKMVLNAPVVTDLILSSFTRDAETAYNAASAVVGTSDEYANRCKADIEHLTVYVGGDVSRFDEGVRLHAPEIDKPADEFWVTYAGSLAKSYVIPTLIRACAQAAPSIRDTGRKLKLLVLGDGPSRKKFEAVLSQCAIDAVFTGYLDYQVMAAYLAKSDILVNSLIKDSPQSIVSKIGDYLSAGKPIINTGESPEFMDKCITDGFGVNVKPENENALAEALVALAKDDELRADRGKKGRSVAEEQFDRPRAYRSIVELVDRTLAERTKAQASS